MNKERNKNRAEGNTTISISMSKELKAKAQKLAEDRGLHNLSALIRMLMTEETKAEEAAHTPTFAPAGASAVESGGKRKPPLLTRKCRGGKHCGIPKAANS